MAIRPLISIPCHRGPYGQANNRSPRTSSMPESLRSSLVIEPSREVTEYQRNLLALLAEFFERATGQPPHSFAPTEKFGDAVSNRAHDLASRAPSSYSWLDKNAPRLLREGGRLNIQGGSQVGRPENLLPVVVDLTRPISNRFARRSFTQTLF
jgi:hypothetical protein